MNEYELLYIVSPRVAADDISDAIERVNALIRDGGGDVISVDNWGRRRLAYPINHYFEGTYVLTTLRLPPSSTAALEAGLVISEEIIRHLLTEGIIPQPQERGFRGEDRERPQPQEPAPEPAAAPAPGEASEPAAEPVASTGPATGTAE